MTKNKDLETRLEEVEKRLGIKTAEKVSHVVMILDRSGSMESIRNEIINDFNEQVQQLKIESAKVKQIVSLITFAGDVKVDVWNEDVNSVKPLSLDTYRPDGSTALYDAVGEAITRMENSKIFSDPNAYVLFVILSDGDENSSREWRADSIARKFKELKEGSRFTVTYMGASYDLAQAVAKNLHLDLSNVYQFNATSKGVKAASVTRGMALSNYMSKVATGEDSTFGFYSDVVKDAEDAMMQPEASKDSQ